MAEHGQTVVLGGLVSDDVEFNRQGIPGLSSIPYLGRLFRSDTRSNVKRNLLVLSTQQLWVMQMMCAVCLSSAIASFIACNWLWIKRQFCKTAEQVDDVYNQKMTPPSIASQPKIINRFLQVENLDGNYTCSGRAGAPKANLTVT